MKANSVGGGRTGPQVGNGLESAFLGVGIRVGDNRRNGTAGLRGSHCGGNALMIWIEL